MKSNWKLVLLDQHFFSRESSCVFLHQAHSHIYLNKTGKLIPVWHSITVDTVALLFWEALVSCSLSLRSQRLNNSFRYDGKRKRWRWISVCAFSRSWSYRRPCSGGWVGQGLYFWAHTACSHCWSDALGESPNSAVGCHLLVNECNSHCLQMSILYALHIFLRVSSWFNRIEDPFTFIVLYRQCIYPSDLCQLYTVWFSTPDKNCTS